MGQLFLPLTPMMGQLFLPHIDTNDGHYPPPHTDRTLFLPLDTNDRATIPPTLTPMMGTIVGISGRNSAPSMVSVGGIVPHHWHRNSAPSLVLVGGIVPIIGVSGGRNSAPSLVSVGGIVS
ncbi:unnamed protein product, partial [Staurois parvus]